MPPTRLTLVPTSTAGFLSFIEQLGIEHDLAVGDRDQVGRDIGAKIAGIGFGDRQRRQRAAAFLLRELRGAFQQPGMNVEHVAGIGFAPGRLTRQQRDLAMGGGVLGQIVDHDQRVLAAIAEIFRHGERRRKARSIAVPANLPTPATTMMQRSGAPLPWIASMARRTLELFWPTAT